jgi:hypothetical protein
MDIAALSIIKSQAQLRQNVGIAVLKKAIGAAEQGGSLVNQMLDKAVEEKTVALSSLPYLGNNIDRLV